MREHQIPSQMSNPVENKRLFVDEVNSEIHCTKTLQSTHPLYRKHSAWMAEGVEDVLADSKYSSGFPILVETDLITINFDCIYTGYPT